jgi:hypothetical protein
MSHAPDPDDESLAAALRASRALYDAPDAVVLRAVSLFRAAAPAPTSAVAAAAAALAAVARRVLAELRFDSAGRDPLVFGLRGGPSDVRQLLYAIDDRDLDLRVEPDTSSPGTAYRISGQVLGPDTAGTVTAAAATAGPGGAEVSAVLNELGEFGLPPVPPGTWSITLRLGGVTIELPPLALA